MPLLRELIHPEEVLAAHGSLAIPVDRIVTDSRDVRPGDLFVCLPGYRTEGGETRSDRHDFIPAALDAGAAALVVERDLGPSDRVTIVRVSDAWVTVAAMAARFYQHPAAELCVVGITGTSGKTSTSYFVDSVLVAAGHKTARMGTIDYRIGETILPAAQTTPEAPVLQSLLRRAVDAGCSAAVMEVSSHALELRRVSCVAFNAAVFTNLSHDHLNFHPDMHHYRRAKGRLFEELASGGKAATAIINVDDPVNDYMRAVNRGALLTYGVERHADVRATHAHAGLDGVSFVAATPVGSRPVRLRHLGEYSVYNALAAVAAGVSLGIDLDTVVAGLAAAPPVPGRFELVDAGQDFVVAVDYAHKPDALRRLLDSARRLAPSHLITVFGCGGDRDRAKRPAMGRIAAERSDYTVVTSDNPRSEDPRSIVDDIVAGMRPIDPHGERYTVDVDRRSAIRRAVARADRGDVVLIAGKGHETYQLVGGQRLDFDDRAEARAALEERLADQAAR